MVTIGALLLGLGSLFSNKAHAAKHKVKKSQAISAYYTPRSGVWCTLFSGGSGAFYSTLTTTIITNKTAKFTTHGGTHILYAIKSTSAPLYYTCT
jgi:hypothetical protein